MSHFFFLLVASRHDNRRFSKGIGFHRRADPVTSPSDLLRDETTFENAEPQAAIFFGNMGVHQPELPRFLANLSRIFSGHIVMRGVRRDLLLGELVGEVAKLLLLFTQTENQS